MSSARYLVGDVFDVLATLPDDSVDLVFSSPPFLALRSYLPADHPDKAKEIGSEATPADFLDTLLDVVEACDRVLAPHGSLCFELGDTFSGSGGAGGDYNEGGLRDGQQAFSGSAAKRARLGVGDDYRPSRAGRTKYAENTARGKILDHDSGRRTPGHGWPDAKSLCLIPTLFAASLAYGYNMLRPERTTPRWRIRNLVVWARPNPPVGALGDKFRPATSYVTVATKSGKRYFDLDSVRGDVAASTAARGDGGSSSTGDYDFPNGDSNDGRARRLADRVMSNPAGAPPLDYWVIPTHPYPGSHYATFPPELVVKPVKAMCPQKVCRVCGEPSRRITDTTRLKDGEPIPVEDLAIRRTDQTGRTANSGGNWRYTTEREDLGWTDCGHDDYRPGHVLDPFGGSGTVGAVATGHGRDCTLIDLDARNADLALQRVGPLVLSVEHLSTEGAA